MQLVLRAWLCLVVFGVHADVEQVCPVSGTAHGGCKQDQQQQGRCPFPGHVFVSLQRKLWSRRTRSEGREPMRGAPFPPTQSPHLHSEGWGQTLFLQCWGPEAPETEGDDTGKGGAPHPRFGGFRRESGVSR